MSRRLLSRLFLVIDVGKRLPVSVIHDKAGAVVFDGPRRRECVVHRRGSAVRRPIDLRLALFQVDRRGREFDLGHTASPAGSDGS
jgi:hypothetical protein